MLAKRLACFALSATLCGVGFTSCGKKEDGSSDTGGEKDVATEIAEAVKPPAPKASAAERAAKLGFAQYLPKDTEGYLGVFDGAGLVAELRASKLGRFVEELAASEGVNLDDINREPQAEMVLSLLKEEFFVAVGKGTTAQSLTLLELQALNSRAQMEMLVKIAAAELAGGDMPPMGGMEANLAFLKDPDALVKLLEGAQMPPITIGFKVSDEEARMGLGQMIAGGLDEGVAFLGPDGENVAEGVTIPAMGSELTGIRFIGEKVVARMKEEGAEEEMAQVLGAAGAAKVLNTLSSKNALAAAGVVGDYVVIFAGSDASEFALAEKPEDSLVGHAEMAFVDGFLDKKLTFVTTLSQSLMASLGNGSSGLGNVADGVIAGLQATEAFGDTQDLEVLLDLVGKQEDALMGMFTYLPAGLVGYREQGFKLDGFGGSTRPDVDLTSKHKYGALADWEGALFYASAIGDKEYAEKSLEWLDTIGETLYLAGKKISQLEGSGGDLADFQQGFGMFDEMFRDDALKLWKALRDDVTAGLGDEAVVLMDLKGGMPVLPLPPTVLEEGKAPRIGVIAPIEDRERLGAAWENINGSLTSILKKVGEMQGGNIPMLRPMSSEKNDLVTWFFQIPIQTDDFLLSVSLDEDTFYMTTSKKFTEEIGAKIAAGGPDVTGEHVRVDVATLRAYLADTLSLVEQNADEIFPGGGQAEEFRANLPQIRAVLDAFSEVQALTAETHLEGGRPHSRIHLHVE